MSPIERLAAVETEMSGVKEDLTELKPILRRLEARMYMSMGVLAAMQIVLPFLRGCT